LRDIVILLLLKTLGRLPLGVARALGTAAGWLLWCKGGRTVRVTETNLALCYAHLGEAERRQLARQSLLEAGRTVFEFAVVWQRSDDWLRRRVKVFHGGELIQEALDKKRGVIVLTPHLGNWEALTPMMTLYQHLIILYQPPKSEALHKFLQQVRHRANTSLAPTTRRGIATLSKALRSGQLVGILPDQVPAVGNGAYEVPFFGEPALTMTLVHSLMQRTGCELLLTYALRVKGGFEVVVMRCDEGVYSADPRESLAAMNRTIASAVATAPEQYQWEYKRFKGREQPEPY